MLRRFQRWLYPELQHAPDPASHRRLLKQASSMAKANQVFIVAFIPAVAISNAALYFGTRQNLNQIVFYSALTLPFFAPLFGLLFYMRPRMRRSLRTLLNERGLSQCVRCGYDTTSIQQLNCPECGKPIIDPVSP